MSPAKSFLIAKTRRTRRREEMEHKIDSFLPQKGAPLAQKDSFLLQFPAANH
jgi:hypothetical protein